MDFFQSQENARKSTFRLILLFSLAVFSIVVLTNLLIMIVFGYVDTEMISIEATLNQFDWAVFTGVGVFVVAIILLGSAYKIYSLSGGGSDIADMLSAEKIIYGQDDLNKQKVLNVVEEMAIASGVPVPPVYLLDEPAINAFAAGYSPADAIIGVTRGTIERLDRDELQGVIAHEFSHILNGDMRMNIRLIGILNGILIIGLIGYYILRSMRYSSRRRSKNDGAGALLALGIGLIVIGYSGTFFGKMIKAAVSRQREYLADASSVQFTRNPDGLANALKTIGGSSYGSLIESPGGEEISHSLFAEGISTYFSSLHATHPPLPDRIKRIEPGWDGKFKASTEVSDSKDDTSGAETSDKPDKQQVVAAAAILASTQIDAAIKEVGQTNQHHLIGARRLLDSLPDNIRSAAYDPHAARALIYTLLLDEQEQYLDEQMAYLKQQTDDGVYEAVESIRGSLAMAMHIDRLLLIDLAMPALRQLSIDQYKLFKTNLRALIAMDKQVELLEWTLQRIVLQNLDRAFNLNKVPAFGRKSLAQASQSCEVVFSTLARLGGQQQHSIEAAFAAATDMVDLPGISLQDDNQMDLQKLNVALAELAQLAPLVKPIFLKACAACIVADKYISQQESEMFRATAVTLDCPMPPISIQS
ncbi:MAG: M48 family metallopeptidase [Gammaproteobacteria bacterium]|nr:MAG: M48 family metallopeptidase [Gammaproteobacteria bacterium]